MVRQRGRSSAQTEKEIEAFGAQAEQPLTPVTELPTTPKAAPRVSKRLPDVPEWKRRNREPKNGGINFRASESQLDLLRQAAIVEELSQQKILERLVWPLLEEKYGTGQKAN